MFNALVPELSDVNHKVKLEKLELVCLEKIRLSGDFLDHGSTSEEQLRKVLFKNLGCIYLLNWQNM